MRDKEMSDKANHGTTKGYELLTNTADHKVIQWLRYFYLTNVIRIMN
jgi:hypothetical protein